MQLTVTQQKALEAAFKKNGAWYGSRGNQMGGAWRRMCLRMAESGLVSDTAPFPITMAGLVVLRDTYLRRWGKHGCMAYQLDLEAVEKALADFPALAAAAERKLAA